VRHQGCNLLQAIHLRAGSKGKSGQQLQKSGQSINSLLRRRCMSSLSFCGNLHCSVFGFHGKMNACLFFCRLCRSLQNAVLKALYHCLRFSGNHINLSSALKAYQSRKSLRNLKIHCEMSWKTSLFHIYNRVFNIRRKGHGSLWFFAVIVFNVRASAFLIGTQDQTDILL